MMQGVLFGDIHSFYDLGLILEPFTPPPAKAVTKYIDIPGADDPIDLTEALGRVFYNPRDFKFEFTVSRDDEMSLDEKYTQVSNALNGKRCRITLDRDPDYYWEGRLTVSGHKLQKNCVGSITVAAKVNAYKLKQKPTVHVVNMTTQDKTVTLMNDKKPVVPTIECTDDNTVIVFGDVRETLSAGTHKVLNICLTEGANVVKIYGHGTITFTYQEGAL